jgi:hypothetical protein
MAIERWLTYPELFGYSGEREGVEPLAVSNFGCGIDDSVLV